MNHADAESTTIFTALSVVASAATTQTYPVATLYVVATPIGNICDITVRALHLLTIADAIACEDTRNTAQLLHRYGLHKPLIAAHQHNEHEVAEKIIARLQQGERIALVSDAGTPAVSDPGAIIVNSVREAGYVVCPLPGASAAISALSASGFVHDQFYFVGFLPAKSTQREKLLQSLIHTSATLVFYEAPHRIIEATQALLHVFGGARRVVFARELTKLFEEVHRCNLAEAVAWLAADSHREKGEFVILIEAAEKEIDNESIEAQRILSILLAECSVKQAASLTAQLTGQKKNALYQLALEMKAADQ
jgi:16S rRNA (cytidine1402-2'-O)-methyltransferase